MRKVTPNNSDYERFVVFSLVASTFAIISEECCLQGKYIVGVFQICVLVIKWESSVCKVNQHNLFSVKGQKSWLHSLTPCRKPHLLSPT